MNKPKKKWKAGGVECSLFANEIDGPNGKAVVLKATVERRYRKANGDWASTNSYSKADIPQVIYCLQQAYAEIIDQDNERAARRRDEMDSSRGE
jgi:hypothetical protein